MVTCTHCMYTDVYPVETPYLNIEAAGSKVYILTSQDMHVHVHVHVQ